MMCELLAIKLARSFANYKLELAAVLITCWNPVVGAPKDAVDKILASLGGDEQDMNDPKSALEVRFDCVSEFIFGLTRHYLIDCNRDKVKAVPRDNACAEHRERHLCRTHRVLGG